VNERTISSILSEETSISLEKHNDIYYSFLGIVKNTEIVIDVIFPASEKDIAKFRTQKKGIITETPTLYNTITLPYIKQLPSKRLEWVFNILEGREEQRDVWYRDTHPHDGFVLLPDLKWNRIDTSSLYCLAIVNKRGISTIRDLTVDHLPLLINIQSNCMRIIFEKYKIEANQLRMYFHYQPTFYHLHVHVTHVDYVPPGRGVHVGKAILLDDVISNITNFPGYYQKANLSFMLGEQEELFSHFITNNK